MGDLEDRRGELVERLRRRVEDERVLEAMDAVPRHVFVPDEQVGAAYEDRPLPIGRGQTVSAPHMVAIMAELLDLSPGEDVLEVGTGCGYHAAVTAELVGAEHAYSVEYHDALAERARSRLERAGYGAVSVRPGDGREGWPAHAPYDRAYLTCAAGSFPAAVVEQVRPGGLVLAPIEDARQRLIRAERRADGSLEREDHGGVRFVGMQ